MAFTHGTAGRSRKRMGIGAWLLNATGLSAATTGTVEEILGTYTLPKGALENVGDGLRIKATFLCAGNGNSKIVRIRMNGISGTILATLTTTANAVPAIIDVLIGRVSATTVSGIAESRASAVAATAAAITAATVANLDTADQTIVATAITSTAAADISLRAFQIEALPATPTPADT
jgi:hypothetical protein